jgi:hypothetical protein
MQASYAYGKLPAQDTERARRFYEEKLGLRPFGERNHHLYYEVGNVRFVVFPSRVLSLTIVDNSVFSPKRLTLLIDPAYSTLRIVRAASFKPRGSLWPFMCSCSCSWSASSSLWRCFVVCAGFIFSLPTQEAGPCPQEPNVSLSHAPQMTAPPVASPAPTRLVWGLHLHLFAPGAR